MRVGSRIEMQTHKLAQKLLISVRKVNAVDVVFSTDAKMRGSVKTRNDSECQSRAVIIFAEVSFKLRALAVSTGRIHVKIETGKSVIAYGYVGAGRKLERLTQTFVSQNRIQLIVKARLAGRRHRGEEVD